MLASHRGKRNRGWATCHRDTICQRLRKYLAADRDTCLTITFEAVLRKEAITGATRAYTIALLDGVGLWHDGAGERWDVYPVLCNSAGTVRDRRDRAHGTGKQIHDAVIVQVATNGTLDPL